MEQNEVMTSSLTMHETAGAGFAPMAFGGSTILTTPRFYDEAGAGLADTRWREVVVARLAELERLAPNWDSDGARPVARRHANRCFALLNRLAALGAFPLPEIVPLADGGVQLEGHLEGGLRVDFVTDDDSAPTVLIEGDQGLREVPAGTLSPPDFLGLLS